MSIRAQLKEPTILYCAKYCALGKSNLPTEYQSCRRCSWYSEYVMRSCQHSEMENKRAGLSVLLGLEEG
jgi:hypothetical protein